MSEVALAAAESSVAKMIGAAFTGAPAPTVEAEPSEVEKFDFDAAFQTKVAALALRDNVFMRRVSEVLRPDFFENAGEAALVNIALRHYKRYGCVPDAASLVVAVRDDVKANVIRKDVVPLVVASRKELLTADLTNADFAEGKIVEFARHQALGEAILKAVELREKGAFDKIVQMIETAAKIGVNDDGEGYDYFAKIAERTDIRAEKLTGKTKPQGITTGVPKLDALLYHSGWGRKELASIMGGAKAGKTTALINFARAAALAGHNVLYATLEVGTPIISDRLDASMSGTYMKELCDKMKDVNDAVASLAARAGKLMVHQYATGTLTCNALRALIDRYRTSGRNADGSPRPSIEFDLIVVDYADIMAPNNRTTDAIENSKSIYVELRAIAFDYNVAVLTATQTNRTGFTAAVAKAEHVSEDFNKVRTVDLLISINKTEEEAARGEARLYFAASRNQEAGFTVVIKQNLAMMRFVEAVLRVE